MKLEVGMYCRYKNFQNKVKIAKIKGIQNADEVFQYDYITFDNDEGELETNIIKASFNVIDILEVGDILSFYEDIDNYKKIYSVGIPDLITLDEIIDKIKNDNIRLIGILTHEQMEQMSYKFGE